MANRKIRFEDLIIFEDQDYIILNKAPFFSTLDDRYESTTIKSLANAFNDNLQLCHRLDKETSGALVLSKRPDAYKNLSLQFEHRKVNKIYHAVSNGVHDIEGMKVEAPILANPRKGKVRIDFEAGKPSTTLIKTHKAYKNHTLFHCKLLTGRMHQVRIHLAHLKAPIIGDSEYGGQDIFLSQLKRKYLLGKDIEEQPIIKRVALHASSIEFVNTKDELVSVEAPYPKDFRVLVKQLEQFG